MLVISGLGLGFFQGVFFKRFPPSGGTDGKVESWFNSKHRGFLCIEDEFNVPISLSAFRDKWVFFFLLRSADVGLFK